MRELVIVCDMDEVLVNLSEGVRIRVNKDFDRDYPVGFNKSYWWQDYGVPKKYFEDLLNEEGFFLNLEPVEGAIETLTKLHKEGYDIHILTCPQHNEFCYIEKVKWVQKYLTFINIETNFHTTGNKGLFAKEDRCLLDDNLNYLNSWQENCGVAIAFNHGWNSEYKGYRAYNWKNVYNLIKNIKVSEENIDVDKFREYMEGEHNE